MSDQNKLNQFNKLRADGFSEDDAAELSGITIDDGFIDQDGRAKPWSESLAVGQRTPDRSAVSVTRNTVNNDPTDTVVRYNDGTSETYKPGSVDNFNTSTGEVVFKSDAKPVTTNRDSQTRRADSAFAELDREIEDIRSNPQAFGEESVQIRQNPDGTTSEIRTTSYGSLGSTRTITTGTQQPPTVTTTGGDVTTTTRTATTYKDTEQSIALREQAQQVDAQRKALIAQKRAENGGDLRAALNDPEVKALGEQRASLSVEAAKAREVDVPGGTVVKTSAGDVVNDPQAEFADPQINPDLQESDITVENFPGENDPTSEPADIDDIPGIAQPDPNLDGPPEQGLVPTAVGTTTIRETTDGTYQVVDENGEVIDEVFELEEAQAIAAEASGEDAAFTTALAPQSPLAATPEAEAAADAVATKQLAQQQKSIRELRGSTVSEQDWRFRMRLAPQADYLYKSGERDSILAPLAATDGVIFPYTPRISQIHEARYNSETLTHSNYAQYFYTGSSVMPVQIDATFTAQTTEEANYLLAVIQFFKSCTKMFYGQDIDRGAPPPLLYCTGFGEYQFQEHPVVINQFNYNLPDDVDYIRAGVVQTPRGAPGAATPQRQPKTPGFGAQALGVLSGFLPPQAQRLLGAGLTQGAEPMKRSSFENSQTKINKPTYVPTKLDISLIAFPVVSRRQVSQNFSLKDYSSGKLITKGYW